MGNKVCTQSKRAVKILLLYNRHGGDRGEVGNIRPKQSTGSPGNSSETQLVNLTESLGTMLFL